MVRIDNCRGTTLNYRVAGEIRADEPSVPRPVVFRISGRMNAHESTSVPNEILECRLFGRIQHITCRTVEHHHPISRQALIGKSSRIRRGFDFKPMLASQGSYGFNAGWNRVVVETRGLREYKYRKVGRGHLR